jgi:hypothetical protein
MRKLMGFLILICLISNSAIAISNGPNFDEETVEIELPYIPYADVYVDDSNIQGPWNGTYDYPFKSIKQGINSAYSGDIIFVFNGNYSENLTIKKSILLKGENKENTKIFGTISIDETNEVIIKKFTIGNVQNYKKDYIIEIDDSSNISIIDNRLTNVTNNGYNEDIDGIFVRTSFFIDINKNIISNLSGNSRTNGIYFDRASECIIKENEIENLKGDWTDGISLRADNYNFYIYRNKITNLKGSWSKGISLDDRSNGNIIAENFLKKIDGRWSKAIQLIESSYNTISDNIISELFSKDGWATGIDLKGGSSNCIISKNTINDILSNGSYSNGIELSTNCNNCTVTMNEIYKVESNSYSEGISINRLSNITISKNSIKNIIMNNLIGIGSHGIDGWKVNNFKITENLIDRHQTGIILSDCYKGIINKNTIDNTILGVGIDTHKIHGRPIFLVNTNFTTLTENLFIQLRPPRDVTFRFSHVLEEGEEYTGGIPDSYEASEKHLSNTWNQNYWYRPRLLPKKISGKLQVEGGIIKVNVPIYNYDYNPLLTTI